MSLIVKLGSRLGVSLPIEPCHSSGSSPCALWLAPGEWLIVQDHPLDGLENLLESELAGHTFHLADVTSARVTFSVGGPEATELLNRACSLDFHPRAFKPGQCARTRFAQIPALIHLSPNGGRVSHLRGLELRGVPRRMVFRGVLAALMSRCARQSSPASRVWRTT